MSTLTIVILLLGAVVVGAVMLFNFWQSRVNRREAERLFRQETGALDEQASIARRRRSSFNQPPAEDPLLGDVDLPLYANDPLEGQDGRGGPSLTGAGSPFDRDAGGAGAGDARRSAREDPGWHDLRDGRDDRGDREGMEGRVLRDRSDDPGAFDEVDPDYRDGRSRDPRAGRQAPDPMSSPDEAPMSADDGVVADRARLRGFADDLRRITDRMPTSPDPAGNLPAMSSRASVAPALDPLAGDHRPAGDDRLAGDGQAWPTRSEPAPMAVTPGEAAAHRQADEEAARVASLPPPVAGLTEPGNPSARSTDAAGQAEVPGGVAATGAGPGPGGIQPSTEPMSVLASVDGGSAPGQVGDARFPDIDLMIDLVPANPINSDRLIALASSLRHAGSKPIRIEIRRGDGPYLPLQSGVMVASIRLSVLLANRQGPLNAVELSDFMSSVASLADHLGASFVPPDLNQVLGRARAVDSLAAELDTQVEILVETPERLSASQVAKLSRELQLYDRGAGNFASLNEGGEIIFMMSVAHPEAIRFTLDVPRVGAGNDPWRSLVDCATRCAETVGGRVTDVEGRGLSVGMIDAVSRQLGRRHEQLARAGLVAGSTAALRVFN